MPIRVTRALKVAATLLGLAAWMSLAHYSVTVFLVVSALPILAVISSMLWLMFEDP